MADLAQDLLTVGQKLKVPRRAVIPNPIAAKAHQYPIGFATLLIVSDGSCKAGCAAIYVHQQFPYKSGTWGLEANFSEVQASCNLLCASVKLTDNKGNNGQVCGELLALYTATELLDFVQQNSLVKFHQVRICSDSLMIMRCLRKTEACYSIRAGKRIAQVQRSIDRDNVWHLPGTVTDACVDACTEYQSTPSSAMNRQWFFGEGVLDKPLQKFPWTARAEYAFPRIEDLPAQWLSAQAKTFLGLKLPAFIVMRAVLDNGEEALKEEVLLNKIADKHHQLKRVVTVSQYVLSFNQDTTNLPNVEQRTTALKKFIRADYEIIQKQLALKATKISQG